MTRIGDRKKPRILVMETGNTWTKLLQITLGPGNVVVQVNLESLENELNGMFLETNENSNHLFLALDYSKEVLKDFLSLFDKMPSKLENLDWLLLNAPKNVRIQSLLREFGFSSFVEDLLSLNDVKEHLKTKFPSSSDATSKRTFEDEMFQRIPLK